jgi:hypothetical protein
MSNPFAHASLKRVALLLPAVLAVVALASSVGPATALAGENFCGVTLQPYGQNGDRCWGAGHPLFGVTLVTYETSGCITVADKNNNLLESWSCAAAKSAPGPAIELHYLNDGLRRKGVIRNNNLSTKGFFAGLEACYSEC